MRTLPLACLALTACYSPLPSADTGLAPISVARGPADAGTSSRPALRPPVTTVVDARAPNPPAAITEPDAPISGGCRGDDFLRGVTTPPACDGAPCVATIAADRSVQVLDASPSAAFTVLATSPTRVVWLRRTATSRTVLAAAANEPARVVVTQVEGDARVLFDREDLLLLERVSAGDSAVTRVTRYPAGRPESAREHVMEFPRAVLPNEGALAVAPDSGGVWALTPQALYRSPARGQGGRGLEVPLPTVAGSARPTAMALTPSGRALVGVGNEVWLTDGTVEGLQHLATLPEGASIGALAPWSDGFAAVVSGEVVVLEGQGPIRRVLGTTTASPYRSTESGLVVSGRQLLVSTLCLSWSSYPGYDVAVVDPDARQARWWWDAYPSQWAIPAFPVSRANVSGNQWVSVTVQRTGAGFVVTSLP